MKDNSLEGLRGVAALTVVLAHSLQAYFPYLSNLQKPYAGAVHKTVVDQVLAYYPVNLLLIADTAVLIFFTLSGYVLTLKYFENRDDTIIQSAAIRRYPRLIIPAAASVFFAWAILSLGWMGNHLVGRLDVAGWPISYYQEARTFQQAIWAAFVGVPFLGDPYFNGPLWSIQVEFLGSLILFASLALFGRASMAMVVIFFLFVATVFSSSGVGILYYVTILGGALIHFIAARLRSTPFLSASALVIGIYLVGVNQTDMYAWLRALPLPNLRPVFPDFNTNPVLFWQAVGALTLVCGVVGNRGAARILASPIPVYLGKISYAVYLLHMPLIMSLLFWTMFGAQALGVRFLFQFAISFAAFMVVLVILAEAFTRWIDKPSIRWAREFDDWLRQRSHDRSNLVSKRHVHPAE